MKSGDHQLEHLSWATDELGSYGRIAVDVGVYSKVAVFKAAYWYTDRCYLFLASGDQPNILNVEIRLKSEKSDPQQLEVLCREFCNNLLDQQVRQDVIAETGKVRDALVNKALLEGRKRLDLDLVRSDESDIPQEGDSSKPDPLSIARATGSS